MADRPTVEFVFVFGCVWVDVVVVDLVVFVVDDEPDFVPLPVPEPDPDPLP